MSIVQTLTALTAKQIAILDGDEARPSPIGFGAKEIALGSKIEELRTAMGEVDSFLDAAFAANADVTIPVDITQGTKDGGTYTVAVTTGGLSTVTRTAADAADSWWVTIPLRGRTTAGKGLTITGYKFQYSVATADVEDVRGELWKETQGADGSAPTAAVVAGQTNSHYDAAHDTAAERGDDTGGPEQHTATVTLPTPEHLGAGEILKFRFYVDGDAAPSGVVALKNLILLGSESLVDSE